MDYFLISFLAGLLTVLAPCVFTLLPIVLGGTLTASSWKKPAIIITSLSISVLVFTLLLRASTLLIDIDPDFWKYLSGGILFSYGIFLLAPKLWDHINLKFKLSQKSDELLNAGSKQKNIWGDILVGISLGPVFSSCSPTYALIIATILPQSPLVGLFNLLFYIAGLALILLMIALFSQSFITKLKWAVNPNGSFKKILGFIFVFIGVSIILGLDKSFETYLLDQGLFNPSNIENFLIDTLVK